MAWKIKQLDWVLIAIVLLLVCFGLLIIYGHCLNQGNFSNFKKQIIFLIAGSILMLFFSFFDWRVFRDNPSFVSFLYLLCVFGLLGLYLFAPVVRGVRRWYVLGPVFFDPVEPLKIVLILILAKYFSSKHIEMYRIRHIFLSGIYFLIPCLLVFFQPDLGSVMVLVFLWLGILLVSGIKTRHFIVLCLIFALMFSLGWSFFLRDYQKERIVSFLQPQLDPLGMGWSQIQSKIAIGSGGLFGFGIGKGAQTQYGFLSEPQTDFVFSAIAEETGFLGVGILFVLFGLLIKRILYIAQSSRDNFSRLFVLGFGFLIIVQVFVNIGMNLGLLPVMGIPLPFVSYGGSNLVFALIGLGIIQNIKIDSQRA